MSAEVKYLVDFPSNNLGYWQTGSFRVDLEPSLSGNKINFIIRCDLVEYQDQAFTAVNVYIRQASNKLQNYSTDMALNVLMSFDCKI